MNVWAILDFLLSAFMFATVMLLLIGLVLMVHEYIIGQPLRCEQEEDDPWTI